MSIIMVLLPLLLLMEILIALMSVMKVGVIHVPVRCPHSGYVGVHLLTRPIRRHRLVRHLLHRHVVLVLWKKLLMQQIHRRVSRLQ